MPAERPWGSDIVAYRDGGRVVPIFFVIFARNFAERTATLDTKVSMVPDIGLEWTSTLETYRGCVGQACSAVHLEWSRVQSVVSKSGLFLSVLQNIHTWH